MGKILIIKGADFSLNSVETVSPSDVKLNPISIVDNKYIAKDGVVRSQTANAFKILLYEMEFGKTYRIVGNTQELSTTNEYCLWGVFSDTVPTGPASPKGINATGGGIFIVNETIIGEDNKYIGLNYTMSADGGPGSTGGQGTMKVFEVVE